jgi:Flp pilus assembly protein TadB
VVVLACADFRLGDDCWRHCLGNCLIDWTDDERGEGHNKKKGGNMPNWLWIIVIILLILWLLGLVTHFLGGIIHILLVIALILVIIWLVQRVRFRKG